MRILLKVVGAAVASIVLAVLTQFCIAYIETPAIVANIQQTGNLTLQLSDISPNRIQWYLKVQDPSFRNHHGIDGMSPGAGYTTITQGLVKRLFYKKAFTPGPLHWRKFQQSVIAVAFNARVPKDMQLYLALNLSYMGIHNGHEVYGLLQASHDFFGKEVGTLSDDEFLSLIATLVAPARYSPETHAAANRERLERIHRLIEGRCRPIGVADVEYIGCRQE